MNTLDTFLRYKKLIIHRPLQRQAAALATRKEVEESERSGKIFFNNCIFL